MDLGAIRSGKSIFLAEIMELLSPGRFLLDPPEHVSLLNAYRRTLELRIRNHWNCHDRDCQQCDRCGHRQLDPVGFRHLGKE